MPLNRLGAVSVAESLNFTPKQIGAGAVDCGLVDLVSRIEVTTKPSRHVRDGGSAHMDIVPDTGQLSQVMVQATAPAFILGAVAGFISILLGRMTSVIDRIRSLNEIADGDTARAHLKSDIPRLRKRAKLLNSATRLALASGNVHVVAPCRGIWERILQVAAHIRSRYPFCCRGRPAGWVALQIQPGGEDWAHRG